MKQLPKSTELNAAMNLLCEFAENLPEDWDIEIRMNCEEASIELLNDGQCVSEDFDTEQSEFRALVNYAREYAGLKEV